MQDKQEGERKGERKGETSPPRHDLGAWVTQKTSERPQILQEAWMQQRSHEWVFVFFFFPLFISSTGKLSSTEHPRPAHLLRGAPRAGLRPRITLQSDSPCPKLIVSRKKSH